LKLCVCNCRNEYRCRAKSIGQICTRIYSYIYMYEDMTNNGAHPIRPHTRAHTQVQGSYTAIFRFLPQKKTNSRVSLIHTIYFSCTHTDEELSIQRIPLANREHGNRTHLEVCRFVVYLSYSQQKSKVPAMDERKHAQNRNEHLLCVCENWLETSVGVCGACGVMMLMDRVQQFVDQRKRDARARALDDEYQITVYRFSASRSRDSLCATVVDRALYSQKSTSASPSSDVPNRIYHRSDSQSR